MKIPESNYSKETANECFDEIQQKLKGLTFKSYEYIDQTLQQKKFNSWNDLFEDFSKIPPSKRPKVTVSFDYNISKKQKYRGIISFGSEDNSHISLTGGTNRQRLIEEEKINRIISKHKRFFTNGLANKLIPTLLFLTFAILNFFLPGNLFPFTISTTVVSAIFSIPLIMYFHCRPHIFFVSCFSDHIKILPRGLRFIGKYLVGFSLITGFVIIAPKLLKRDQILVANSPGLQKQVLRKILTVDFLQRFYDLKALTQLYDNTNDNSQKDLVAKTMASKIYEIIHDKELTTQPIKLLKLFVSSNYEIRNGNWLQEPLLLQMKMGSENNGKSFFYYTPRIENESNNRPVDFGTWLNGLALKDRHGKLWTREGLIASIEAEQQGEIPKDEQTALDRVRKFPENNIEFQDHTGNVLTPQNSVISETIRAIGEELLHSEVQIQRTLSESPHL